MLILMLLLGRYPDSVEVYELSAIALQYNRAMKALRDAGCVIPNSFFRVSAAGERRSRYRLVWCPAHLAPENHPAARGPRPEIPVKRTKAEYNLKATKAQIERSRTLSLRLGPGGAAATVEHDVDPITFRLPLESTATSLEPQRTLFPVPDGRGGL
jgi:hypothetical protein